MNKYFSHLKQNWVLHLAAIVIVSIFWTWLIGMIVEPPRSQKIVLFSGSPYVLDYEIEKITSDNNIDSILKWECYYAPSDDQLLTFYTSYGTDQYDFIIVNETEINEYLQSYLSSYQVLDDIEELNNLDTEYFIYENKKLGIKVDSKYIDTKVTDTYYVFIYNGSIHLNIDNVEGKDNIALDVIKYIVGEK